MTPPHGGLQHHFQETHKRLPERAANHIPDSAERINYKSCRGVGIRLSLKSLPPKPLHDSNCNWMASVDSFLCIFSLLIQIFLAFGEVSQAKKSCLKLTVKSVSDDDVFLSPTALGYCFKWPDPSPQINSHKFSIIQGFRNAFISTD